MVRNLIETKSSWVVVRCQPLGLCRVVLVLLCGLVASSRSGIVFWLSPDVLAWFCFVVRLVISSCGFIMWCHIVESFCSKICQVSKSYIHLSVFLNTDFAVSFFSSLNHSD